MRRQRGRLVKELDLQIRGPQVEVLLSLCTDVPAPSEKIGRRGRRDVCTQAKSRSDL